MQEVFTLVYKFLKWLSSTTGFTYHEVNIILYYILIPAVFMILLDRIFKTNWLKIAFGILVILTLLLVPSFKEFSTTLFNKSVTFLKWFQELGLNYVQASVVICVVVPFFIILILIYLKRQNA